MRIGQLLALVAFLLALLGVFVQAIPYALPVSIILVCIALLFCYTPYR